MGTKTTQLLAPVVLPGEFIPEVGSLWRRSISLLLLDEVLKAVIWATGSPPKTSDLKGSIHAEVFFQEMTSKSCLGLCHMLGHSCCLYESNM